MSEYIIKIPHECFSECDDIHDRYYPDERHDPMPLEEIVRCRDCEYYDGEPDMESMGEKCWRDPSHSGRSIPTVANGFCWRGERKEGGE